MNRIEDEDDDYNDDGLLSLWNRYNHWKLQPFYGKITMADNHIFQSSIYIYIELKPRMRFSTE